MLAELFPWRLPFLLKAVGKKLPLLPESMRTRGLPPDARFTDEQQRLVATIVHNAGIYNGILAGGLLWAAFPQNDGLQVARVLLAGAAVAGIFGTVTLKSRPTAIQAAIGILGLFVV